MMENISGRTSQGALIQQAQETHIQWSLYVKYTLYTLWCIFSGHYLWNRHLGCVSSRCIIQQHETFDISEENACKQLFCSLKRRILHVVICKEIWNPWWTIILWTFFSTWSAVLSWESLSRRKRCWTKWRGMGKDSCRRRSAPPNLCPRPWHFWKVASQLKSCSLNCFVIILKSLGCFQWGDGSWSFKIWNQFVLLRSPWTMNRAR